MELSEGEYETFQVPDITQEQIRLLQSRLNSTVWPNELENVHDWSYGAPTWAVRPLVEEWANEFNWNEFLNELGQWQHYRMKIDDLLIHYVHEPSSKSDAIPIVLVHGWPSTFYEFHKIIDSLRDGTENNQAFHVVVPSLPGYGFSQAPKEKGFGVNKIASIINRLMTNLGYDKYLYHGGDWGAIIGKQVATQYTKNCKAFHTTMPLIPPALPTLNNLVFHPIALIKSFACLAFGLNRIYGSSKDEYKEFSFGNAEVDSDAGYRAIQGTRPYTLSYGLTDSPVGLLSWLLEKYHNWTHHPKDKDKVSLPGTISSKEFLTQISIYWMSNTISSSIRLYYESFNQNEHNTSFASPVNIPLGVSVFASELAKVCFFWIITIFLT
ncbi:unnamed protein product [Rhizopus stolonifer]